MYNMEISIGSYKCRLEIVILIVFVFWIMCGHMLCGCSRVGLMEGMETIFSQQYNKEDFVRDPVSKRTAVVANNRYEGFVSSNNMASGPEFAAAQSSGYIMKPSKWAMPTLTYSSGTTPDAGVKSIWDRPKQPVPLPEGQLDMLATTDFKPECCPNAYSSSTGCACMTSEQYNFLKNRGFNNVPYSQF